MNDEQNNIDPAIETQSVTIDLHSLKGLTEQFVMDTSEKLPSYVLITKSGHHMRLSQSAYALIQKVHQGTSLTDIVEEMNRNQQQQVTLEQVETAYQHVIEKITAIEQRPHKPMFGMWMCFSILPDKVVSAIAQPLSVMFNRPVVIALLAMIVAAIFAIIWQHPTFQMTPIVFWEGYLLFLLSLMVHELGHASACARYGATPGDIGFGIYWLYPVFYSDVSAVWPLRRWQRVVVDLGGVYLQFGVGVVYIIIYLIFQWEPAFIAVLQILYSAVFALNPIMKFDGYWVLSDAFGVTNLSQQPKRIIQHGIGRLRGRLDVGLPWSTGTIVFVLLYTVISMLFWGYFTWRILPFAMQTISSYPSLLWAIMHDLGTTPSSISAARWQSLGMATFIVCITLLMLFRIVYPLLQSTLTAMAPLLTQLKQAIVPHQGRPSSVSTPDS